MKANSHLKNTILLLSTVLTVGLAFSAQAHSSDEASCPNVDLRQEFSFGAVANQKSVGWCFGYGAADALGYTLNQRVSSFDIALSVFRYQLDNGKIDLSKVKYVSDFGGATPNTVLAATIGRGVCEARKFSSSHPLAVDYFKEVEIFIAGLTRQKNSGKLTDLQLRQAVLQKAISLRVLFPTSTIEKLTQAIRDVRRTDFPILDLVDNICGNRYPIYKIKYEYQSNYADGVSMDMLKSQLAQHRPLYLQYSSRSLLNINYVGSDDHVSSVIGMRFNRSANRCEFLLRNSWGQNFGQRQYDPELKKTMASGYVWIPESVMKSMAAFVLWYER